MDNISLGLLIKQRRKMLGLSQTDLAYGVMDVSNLSKFETGKQAATKSNLEQLLQRLGIQKQSLLEGYVSKDEQIVIEVKRKIDTLIFERKLDEAEQKLEQLAAIFDGADEFQDKFNKQYLLRTRAAIAASREDFAQTRELLFRALEITCGNFSEENITDGFYTNYESDLINMLAVSYGESGERERAIKIYKALIKSIDQTDIDNKQRKPQLTGLLYNLSKYLSQEQKNEEAMQICNRGINLCFSTSTLYALPDLYYNKAHLLYEMGQRGDCKKLLETCCQILWDMKHHSRVKRIYLKSKQNFGIEIEICGFKSEQPL